MAYNPYIYYAVAESTGCPLMFAAIEEGFESSYTIGVFERIPSESTKIVVVWYDFNTKKYYTFSHSVEDGDIQTITFMIVATGGCVMWITHSDCTKVVTNFQCEQTTLDKPDNGWEQNRLTMQGDYEKHRQVLFTEATDFFKATQRLMTKYAYRFWPVVGGEKEIDLIGIKEFQSDGAIKYLNERDLFDYRFTCKPKKLEIKFTCEESEYDVFVWMEELTLYKIFERFYGAHPETKSDFIIRIDAENKKYELALYRQGLKEPVVIPESAYQLIVFKNKFEDYRSENYNQPRGAWIW